MTRYRVDQISRLGISRTFQLIRVFPGLSVQDNVRVGGLFGRAVEAPCLHADEIEPLLTITDFLPRAQQPARSLAIAERTRGEQGSEATRSQLVVRLVTPASGFIRCSSCNSSA